MEAVREVHKPWVEQTEEESVEWQPAEADMYTGAKGGAPFVKRSVKGAQTRTEFAAPMAG